MLKNWCFWTVVLEKTLESPLDCKEIKLVNSNGNQPWIFIGRTDAEAEAPVVWPLDAKSQLIGKDPDAGKDWKQEEKGVTEGKVIGWHHWFNGHEFEQTPGNGEGQGSLACCSPRGHKEGHDLGTEQQQPSHTRFLFESLCEIWHRHHFLSRVAQLEITKAFLSHSWFYSTRIRALILPERGWIPGTQWLDK